MSKTYKYPLPVVGVDLLSNETSLIKGAVRSAVNVDIGRAGSFKRRAGFTRLVAGSDFHSIWAAEQKGWLVCAKGAELFRLDPTTHALTSVAALTSSDPLSYTEYNGNLYFTNRRSFGWVPSDSAQPRAVGVRTPYVMPVLSAGAGALLPGKYALIFCFANDRGELGGATAVQTIDLPQGGGIVMAGLPVVNGVEICTFLTDANGEILRAGARFPAVFPSYTITDPANGSEAETQFLVPLPPGEFVAWLAGRLYTAKDAVLSFSDPLRPHLYNPAKNFVQFSGAISFIEAVGDGMYVGDDRGVWFLRGTDPSKFEQVLVNSNCAVKRSSVKISPKHFPEKKVPATTPVVVWLSTAGYVVGMDGGVAVELQPDRIRVPTGLVGRTTFLLREGIKQIVTPVNSTSTVAFGTAVDTTVGP